MAQFGSFQFVSWTFVNIVVILLMELEELDVLFNFHKALLTFRCPLGIGFRMPLSPHEYYILRRFNSFA